MTFDELLKRQQQEREAYFKDRKDRREEMDKRHKEIAAAFGKDIPDYVKKDLDKEKSEFEKQYGDRSKIAIEMTNRHYREKLAYAKYGSKEKSAHKNREPEK